VIKKTNPANIPWENEMEINRIAQTKHTESTEKSEIG
jgi:hypothetical protein